MLWILIKKKSQNYQSTSFESTKKQGMTRFAIRWLSKIWEKGAFGSEDDKCNKQGNIQKVILFLVIPLLKI